MVIASPTLEDVAAPASFEGLAPVPVSGGVSSEAADALAPLLEAERLALARGPRAALPGLIDHLDDLVHAGRHPELEAIMGVCNPDEYHIEILLAVLTVTLCVRSSLPSRPAFFQHVRESIERRHPNPEGLLSGLE